ncbi:GyrI-like domain-containing protein [Brevibacillus reuszeri]|uniref:GyrI-like domain-containing protein n=1 Tax=Brevibacillus reuszeri TaxID=54915 RepID=UPI0028A1B080|nr:GyrI-like domain-containing protein [Brevibacillus reuszeri]
MDHKIVKLGEKRIAGLKVVTTNEAEHGPNAKIGALWQRYYAEGFPSSTPNQAEQGVVYGVYSDYESDEKGSYSLLIGVEVEKEAELPVDLSITTVPQATYAVFTTRVGPVTEVVIEAWEKIWEWSKQPGNKRTFIADFERYDGVRCADPNHAQVEVYIAISEE